jgi:hypothetical protein
MPKLLVLYDPRSDDLTRLAEAVAEGARSVRFAEVDIRRIGDAPGTGTAAARHRAYEGPDALAAYDGIVAGSSSAESAGGAAGAAFRAPTPSLVNKVGSAFTAAPDGEGRRDSIWGVLAPMGDRGMILVPPPVADAPMDELESARQQGRRVAEVVGWVTHARSHHHHH